MKIRIFLPAAFLGMLICVWGSPASSDELKRIRLMPMQLDTGRPLMHVLKERKSNRAFNPKKLPNRVLSNLLWAANGINRPGSGGRTAPSAMNQQEIDIYVATAEGLYLYDVRARQLIPVLNEDIRGRTGQQAYVGEAPVNGGLGDEIGHALHPKQKSGLTRPARILRWSVGLDPTAPVLRGDIGQFPLHCKDESHGARRDGRASGSGQAEVGVLPVSLVFHSETAIPAPRMAKVMPSDHSGGNFCQPIRSAMKIFEPMNTSRIDSAYLR